MGKISVSSAEIKLETEGNLVIATGSSAQRSRSLLVGIMVLGSLGGVVLGLVGREPGLVLWTGLLCALPTLILLVAVPQTYTVTVDAESRSITVTDERMLGLGPWRRRRERTINFHDIIGGRYTVNPLGTMHRVELTGADDSRIVFQFGPHEQVAKRVAAKVNEMLGPALAPGAVMEPVVEHPAVPFTGWRLALAAVYGLVVALAVGYLWYLVTAATSTRFGFAALLLGFAVGSVVSFMGGGSDDNRYAILGAVLSGIGIAFGEFLIFGSPGSTFAYEFEFMTLVIYGIALYEGWIIPRRSMPIARKGSQVINEGNWKPFLAAGGVALLLILGLSATTGRLPSGETQAKIHYNRGLAFSQEGKFEEAITEYQEAIRLMPDYAQAHNDLGAAYYGMGRMADAKAEFETAIHCDPDLALAHVNLANVLDDEGRYEEGIREVNEALRMDPSLPVAHLVSGHLNANLGNPAAAQAAFEEAIELEPSLFDAHFMLGLIHLDHGDWDSALESLVRALDLAPGPVEKSAVLMFRGLVHGAKSDYEGAMADLDEAIRLGRDNAVAYHFRGLVRAEIGEQDEAMADLETALELGLEGDLAKEARSVLRELQP